MKTAISIPDEVFEAADRTAKKLGVSRSELYATAVHEFIERNFDLDPFVFFCLCHGPIGESGQLPVEVKIQCVFSPIATDFGDNGIAFLQPELLALRPN